MPAAARTLELGGAFVALLLVFSTATLRADGPPAMPLPYGFTENLAISGTFPQVHDGLAGVLGYDPSTCHRIPAVTVLVKDGAGRFAPVAQVPLGESCYGSAVLAVDGASMFAGIDTDGDGVVSVIAKNSTGAWTVTQRISPANYPGARFGHRLAVSGDWMAVESPGQVSTPPRIVPPHPSFVEIYHYDGTTWVFNAELQGNPGFGQTLSMQGAMLLVGEVAGSFGVVHEYDLMGGVWVEGKGIPNPPEQPWNFGIWTSLSGDHLVVDADGWAFLYEHINGVWVRGQRLSAVATLGGDTLLAGSPPSVYRYRDGSWVLSQTLLPVLLGRDTIPNFASGRATDGNDIILLSPDITSFYQADDDADGLSSAGERSIWGTDPLNPDTDCDRLTDFEEIARYSTNPRQFDTDGDLFGDGTEVHGGRVAGVNMTGGSDPLDPYSIPTPLGPVTLLAEHGRSPISALGLTVDCAGSPQLPNALSPFAAKL